MTLPTTYLSVLLVTILGLVALGSWINTLKLTKKWRYELFYFDFAIGVGFAAVIAAFTLGTLGADGFTLLDDLMRAGKRNMAWGIAAGMLFNLGYMLLVGASTLLGITVAFPLGLGTALVVSSLLSYVSSPQGNPTMVFTGLALVALAVVLGVITYRTLSLARELQRMKAGEHRTLRPSVSWKGVLTVIISGLLLGVLNPLVSMATTGDAGIGPYSLALMFAVGIVFSTFVYNLFLMNLPLSGRPLEIPEYFRGQLRNHVLGCLGGVIWATGMIAAYVAAVAPEEARVAPGVSFALLQAAPLVTALWGLLVWKEFKGAGVRPPVLLAVTLFLYLAALVMLCLAPFSATA
jgi:glucose uptake protein